VAKVAQPVREDHPASDLRSPKQVGRQLRNVRRKQGLSRAEVARSAGLTRRELAAYERGRVEIPESDLWCLAGSCGVDVGELLPQRTELRIDSSISTLAIGDSIRHLRMPDEPDGMLRQYLAMIYELRNLPPGATVPLREADLSTLADALGGTPDAIYLPYGGGGNTTSYGQAFAELGGVPARLIAAEARDRANTVASAIRIAEPAHRETAERAIRTTEGALVTLDDDAILAAWADLARSEGLFCEPSSAAGIAALAVERPRPGSTVVCIVTGHGLKDPAAAEAHAPTPISVEADPDAIAEAAR